MRSRKYIVHVSTADRGEFKIHTTATSCIEAESIARQCVRYQFTNDITSSHAWPK